MECFPLAPKRERISYILTVPATLEAQRFFFLGDFLLNLTHRHKARSAKKIFFALPSLELSRARARRQKKFFSLYLLWNSRGRGHGARKTIFRFTFSGTLEGAGTAPKIFFFASPSLELSRARARRRAKKKEKRKKKKEKRKKKKKRFATQP